MRFGAAWECAQLLEQKPLGPDPICGARPVVQSGKWAGSRGVLAGFISCFFFLGEKMKVGTRAFRMMIPAILAAGFLPAPARADIMGFGDFSGFSINLNDGGSAPTIAPGLIHLTNSGGNEARSVIALAPQTITQFTASFTYQNSGPQDNYGATFVLENAPAGASAVGFGNVNLGYAFSGASAAITLEPAGNASGFYKDGSLNNGSLATAPVNLRSGDPINVTLVYSGSTLAETLADPTANTTYTNTFFVGNLATVLGSSTAFVGVTASTNGGNESQTFSNFEFTNGVPEPASLSVMALSGLILLRRRRAS